MVKVNHDWTRNWTWDIVHQYHKCPKCQYIIESREDFEKRRQLLVKDLQCPKCEHIFSESKKPKPSLGPLL